MCHSFCSLFWAGPILAWIATLKFWLSIYLRAEPNSVLTHLKWDPHISAWSAGILSRLTRIGLAEDNLFMSDESYVWWVKQRLLDLECHNLCPAEPYICFPALLGMAIHPDKIPIFYMILRSQATAGHSYWLDWMNSLLMFYMGDTTKFPFKKDIAPVEWTFPIQFSILC